MSADASPASITCAFSPSETTEPPAVVVGWWCVAALPQGFCFATASPSDHAGYDEPRTSAHGTSFQWILPGLAQGWNAGAAPASTYREKSHSRLFRLRSYSRSCSWGYRPTPRRNSSTNTGQGRTGGLRWLGLRPVLYPPAPFPFAPLPCPCRPKGRQGVR